MAMLFFSLSLTLLQAEETDESEEAPSYLWSYKINDRNVDFYWDGYWRFHFSSGLALRIDEDGLDGNSSFSDYTAGFRFLQTPDLLLSLWIDDRYYFETSVVEDYDKNTYLLGYQGQEEEYIQSVRLGNSSISTESYAGLSVSSPLYNTPGVAFKGASDRMQNELMVRFDGTWEESRLYIGTYEANEEYLELYDYLPARRFLLPDGNVEDLRVYIRDDDGPYSGASYSYRQAEEGDYLIDRTEGILTLEEEFEGPVAVYYTAGGLPIGDPSLGVGAVIPPTATGSGIPDVTKPAEDFNWADPDPYDTQGRTYTASRQETINGHDCLLIYEPGRFSPFAFYGDYRYSQIVSADSWKNSLHLADRYGSETGDPAGFSWEAENSEKILTLYRSGAGTEDALSRYPLGDRFPEIYGNASVNRPELVSHRLHLVSKTGSSGYRLGTGVVPGSLTVTVNGRVEYNYTLDSDRGTVTFNRYIFPDDRIEFSYRRETLNFEGQEMLIYQGNRFVLSDRDTLETAESFNWVFPDGTDNSTPDGGTIQLGVTWDHKGEELSLKTNVTGEADLGDADGMERIQGMEDALSAYPFFDEALAEPRAGNDSQVTDNDYPDSGYVRMNGLSGPVAVDSDGTAPFDSPALSSTFTLADGDWTAADLHLTPRGTADYSTLQEIRFYVKIPSGTTPGDLVLKLGETGERNDFNNDGYVSGYDEALVATKVMDLTGVSADTWTQVTWSLSADERQMLSRTRSLRFLFPRGGTETVGTNYAAHYWTSVNSRVLIGGLELVGQTFALSVENGEAEIGMSEIYDSSLESAYPDEIDQFHADGSDQRVTRFTWNGINGAEKWRAVSWIEAKDLTRFGKVSFFIKNDATPGTFALNLTDTAEKGVHLIWDTDGSVTDWQKVTIDLTERTARFDGGVSSYSLSVDRGAASLNRISLTGETAASGNMWIDEIYFEESVIALNGRTTVSLNYAGDGYLTGPSGFRWLGAPFLDLVTSGSLSGKTGGIAGESGSLSFQGQTGADIMYLGLTLQGDGTWDDEGFILWGGHGLTFPVTESPVVLKENFSLGDDSDTPLLSHTASADLFLPASIKAKGAHEAILKQNKLGQDWSGSVRGSWDRWQFSLGSDWALLSKEEPKHKEGYFSVWGDSWSFFLPDTTDVERRNSSGSMRQEWKGEKVSPRLSLSWDTALVNSFSWKQTSGLSSSLEIPIILEWEHPLTLTPRYTRSLSLTKEESYSNSFFTDYRVWSEHIMPSLPLSHFLPFFELTDSQNVMGQLPRSGTYSYTPAFSLALNRNYGSRPADLILPSLAEAKFSRYYKGEADSRYFQTNWDFTIQQRALNVFGSFGTRPVFPFYATEEIANTYNLGLREKNSTLPAFRSFSWNSYNRFEGEGGSILTAENDLSFDFSEEKMDEQFSAAYLWKTGRKPFRKIPFYRYIIQKESYVQNSESLSYSFNESSDDYLHEIGAVHKSVLHIEELGTLAGWFRMGVNWNDLRTKAGSELGVELTLTF